MPATKTMRNVRVTGLEWRDLETDAPMLEGYASTFSQPYDMGWYTETVMPGAFTKTLSENPDVRLLINHEGLPLGRTRSGTLTLTEDAVGLKVSCALDISDPDVLRLLPKMKRGDLDEMSFAFRTIREVWDEAYSKRLLTELSLAGGDVSIVTYPANPNASVSVRAAALIQDEPEKLRDLYRRMHEDREGITLSSEEIIQLSTVLESLATIDESVGESLEALVGVLGAERDSEGNALEENNDEGDDESLSFIPASTTRARVQLELLRH
jgi:HK97 family phage prohead protease